MSRDVSQAVDEAGRARLAARLVEQARLARLPDGGFGWLDGRGGVDTARPLELWINARMTYVLARAHAGGDGAAYDDVRHGLVAIKELFGDRAHGGWFPQVHPSGEPVRPVKACYEHAFVVLAAATAARAGVEGGRALLDEALEVHQRWFWEEPAGACAEERSADWSAVDGYRGANSNMHTVEAYLAAEAATGEPVWRDRALRIAALLVDRHARGHRWRLPEHYDAHWVPQPGLNRDRPADPFRPYGATPGHALEWSRLLVELDERHRARGGVGPDWLLPAAVALFDRAVADGVSDTPGLPYTTDWSGRPVVTERFHWVMAEAVQAATALHRATGTERYAALRDRWWREIDRWFIDHRDGSWRHELDTDLSPSTRTWQGRPDVYHAWNALTC